jgi:hypothetical protein
MGDGWSNLSAELAVQAPGYSEGLARTTFTQTHLVHSWMSGSDIRMVLYAETMDGDVHRWTEMRIQRGRYTLIAFASDDGRASRGKPRVLRGRVHCSGDTDG